MMRREIFSEEHEMFRAQVRRFVDSEIEPKVAEWNRVGMSDRASWGKMGEAGFLGANAPAEYGGGGVDFIYDAIVMEELSRVRAHGLMMSLHSDICMPYIASFGNEEQKRRYLPGAISGETILAIAMTEPGTGSDLAAVQTTARRDGDHYVINGSKIFISNGQIADLVIVACKTDPKANPPHKGVSLMLVDASAPGFVRGRKLDKLGLARAGHQRVVFRGLPRAGGEPAGQGRHGIQDADGEAAAGAAMYRSVSSMASCRRTLEDTIAYCKNRKAFGQPIAEFQNTQFKLAEMMTEVEVGQAFVDKLLVAHVRGDEIVAEVSMAKWWTTDLQKKISEPMPTVTRRLWVHDGVSGIDGLRGCGGAIDIRGDE